jgi:hypothetical protein
MKNIAEGQKGFVSPQVTGHGDTVAEHNMHAGNA